MQQNISSFLRIWPIRVILIIWALFVILDYLFRHPYYEKALLEFRYGGLVFLLALILGASWFFIFRPPTDKSKKNHKTGLKINGLGLYGLLLGLMIVIYGYYCSVNDLYTDTPLAHVAYFARHTLMLHVFILLIFVFAFVFGEGLLSKLKKYFSPVSFQLISLATGLSFLGIIAVVLGLLNVLNTWTLWLILVAGLTLNYQAVLPFLRTLLLKPTTLRLGWQGLLSAATLGIFIAINAIGAIKNFPAGFDGANLYMNTSKLIAEYHSLPAGGQAFNWSVIMSFGELLFESTAVSILLSHLTGLLCLIAVFRIAKLFMQSDKALLAATVFYIAPYISFHNFRDEKVDLGFLFISLSALLLLLEFYFRREKKEIVDSEQSIILWKNLNLSPSIFIWILAGWLTGFAFGIKYIAILNFIALFAYLFYRQAGKIAFLGISTVALGAVFLFRIDRFAGIDLTGTSPLLIAGLFIVAGMATLSFSFWKGPKRFKRGFLPGIYFTAFFLLAYAPWAIKHLSENQTFNVTSIIQGKSPRPVVTINPDYFSALERPGSSMFSLENLESKNRDITKGTKARLTSYSQEHTPSRKEPRAKFVDQKTEDTLSAGEQVRREELHRYLGFEGGLPLYLSLPYDLTMNTNFPGHTYLDFGFLFLLLLPLLLLSSGAGSRWRNLTLFLLVTFLIVMALQAVYGGNGGFNSNEAMKNMEELIAGSGSIMSNLFGGVYKSIMSLLFTITAIFYPLYAALAELNFLMVLLGLILVLTIVIWIAKDTITSMPFGLKSLAGFLLCFLFFWILLGNGIPWYAFPALSLLPVLLVYYYSRPEQILGEEQKTFFTYFFNIAIGLYFGMNLISHFHDHNNGANAHIFLKTPYVRYAGAQMTKSDVLAKFNPFFPSAVDIMNGDPATKIYRVGTYLNYHILNNDRRVYEDNQLGLFDEITSHTKPGHFLQVLNENGFRYIIYDLRTASIDKTPEKSLTKKNQAFVHQLLNSGQAELLVTDRIVEDPTGNILKIRGFTFPGKAGLIGNAVYQGTFALFEIK